jgi:hypothetical protein
MVNAAQTLSGAEGGMSSPVLLKILLKKLVIIVNLILFLY